MVKKLISLFFLFLLSFSFAQQNEEFKAVKQFYDYQRSMLNKEFKKQFDKEVTDANKIAIKNDFQEFMVKLDSIQNTALLYALVRVKTREDLTRLKIKSQISADNKNPLKADLTKNADYPGGFNLMRKQILDLFYTNGFLTDEKMIRTDLLFVVEKDGSISSVKAEGENVNFNKQAEIAIYLLPEKFTPAFSNGSAVRYRFRLPLSMNFD